MRCHLAVPLIAVAGIAATAQSRPIFDDQTIRRIATASSPGFEAKPDISHDKLTLYFATDQPGGGGGLDLWFTTRATVNSPFGPAQHIPELAAGGRDHTPTSSGDGLLMVFSSDRPGGLGTDDAWYATRPDLQSPWSAPIHIPELSSPQRDMGFSMTPDGLVIYFTSDRFIPSLFEIYTSSRPSVNSPWAAPVPVAELNTPWQDKFPSVTGDNLTMFFASDRPGGVKDPQGQPSRDLWVAMRPDTRSRWTIIENVYEVDSPYADYLMSIADDGSELFFATDRPGSMGSDIWHVKALPGVTRYGEGTSGELGVPRLRPTGGSPQPGNQSFGYEVTNVSPYAWGLLIHSNARSNGQFAVDLNAGPTLFNIQLPVLTNPPGTQPRTLAAPLPNDPSIVGFTSWWQAVMLWDQAGQDSIFGIRFAASPGLSVTYGQ